MPPPCLLPSQASLLRFGSRSTEPELSGNLILGYSTQALDATSRDHSAGHHTIEDEGFYIIEAEMTFCVGDQRIKSHPQVLEVRIPSSLSQESVS
jgi:hypothetical protein